MIRNLKDDLETWWILSSGRDKLIAAVYVALIIAYLSQALRDTVHAFRRPVVTS